MTQVTKSTMIGELLQIDQNIAPILLNIGMHCLGCPSSQMETIEEAAMVHGIDPEALVNEINEFLAKRPRLILNMACAALYRGTDSISYSAKMETLRSPIFYGFYSSANV